jgi:hypothetical protein
MMPEPKNRPGHRTRSQEIAEEKSTGASVSIISSNGNWMRPADSLPTVDKNRENKTHETQI